MSSKNKVTSFKMEDDDGEHFAFECPHCGEINDIGDEFLWKNGRYEMVADCEFCVEGMDILIIRGED